jgi:hypothetical protein
MLSEVAPAAEPSINDNNDNNNGGELVNEDSTPFSGNVLEF